MANPQVGAVGVSLEYTVLAIDPLDGLLKPVNISGATNLKIRLYQPTGKKCLEYAAEFKTDGTDGIVRYLTVNATDLERSGMWLMQPSLTLGTFSGLLQKAHFYVEPNLVIQTPI